MMSYTSVLVVQCYLPSLGEINCMGRGGKVSFVTLLTPVTFQHDGGNDDDDHVHTLWFQENQFKLMTQIADERKGPCLESGG